MINWNDIRVEQEIAQERYQTIIQGRQLDQVRSERKKGKSIKTIFSWAFKRFGHQPVPSGNYC